MYFAVLYFAASSRSFDHCYGSAVLLRVMNLRKWRLRVYFLRISGLSLLAYVRCDVIRTPFWVSHIKDWQVSECNVWNRFPQLGTVVVVFVLNSEIRCNLLGRGFSSPFHHLLSVGFSPSRLSQLSSVCLTGGVLDASLNDECSPTDQPTIRYVICVGCEKEMIVNF